MGVVLASCLIGFERQGALPIKIATIRRKAKMLGSHCIATIITRPTVSVPLGIIMSSTGSSRILRGKVLSPILSYASSDALE